MDCENTPDGLDALSHTKETKARIRYAFDVEPLPIVGDRERHAG
jgi:hypothetical protein